MTTRADIKIFGQVQGVFFRHSAKREAERLGLTGWVRNNDDGSVEIRAEGPRDKLEEFIVWCKKGPPAAKVERVEIEWGSENLSEAISSYVYPDFDSGREFIMRKTNFVSGRTFGISSNKAAIDLNRRLIRFLQKKENKISINIDFSTK